MLAVQSADLSIGEIREQMRYYFTKRMQGRVQTYLPPQSFDILFKRALDQKGCP